METTSLSTKIHNASTNLKKSGKFNVRFLGIPENLSDFLSRQVKNITPATISFAEGQHANRRATFNDIGKIDIEYLIIMILPDDEGIIDSIVMSQVFRQKGRNVSTILGEANTSPKFDVKIEYFNQRGAVTFYELYRNCYIKTMTRPDYETGSSMNSQYTLTLTYDGIDFMVEDQPFSLSRS